MTIFILLIIRLLSVAQNDFEVFIVPGGSDLDIDNNGNLYILNQNKLTVYSPYSGLQKDYYSQNSSNLTAVDHFNEFKIILYDEAFRNFILLDNNLNPIDNNSITINESIYGKIQFCRTNTGFIVIDCEEKYIFFHNKKFTLSRKAELNKLSGKTIINIEYYANIIYILTADNMLFLYDSEGALIQSVKVPPSKLFHINKFGISLLSEDLKYVHLHSIDNLSEIIKIPLTEKLKINDIGYFEDTLWILNDTGLFLKK
ncbi:MAG: hypothetical protein U9N85_00620 [Bacteroidota bacterium]|nr:hypothetical protein [Bacteroidota bacterium]